MSGTPMPGGREKRPEIQALRAIAVGLVVVFHVWPSTLPGGFVGVDVFFVISGFLITAGLLREARGEGRVRLGAFWARRARRLLPAAFVVLAFCLVATLTLIPRLSWEQFLTEIAASAFYVENWQLAADAVDYLAAENEPSLVQHFWSLSVEEQFYLVWPLLIGAAALVRPARRTLAFAAALGTVTVASLALSLWWTAADPAFAYFATPARAWEFGAGGLLGLATTAPAWQRRTIAPVIAGTLSWAGLAAIFAAALAFDESTPFPGTAALLPVLGTVAVIAAGLPTGRLAPSALLRVGPVQQLGDVSYAVYLWHWPVLLLVPYTVATTGFATQVGVVVVTVALSALTKRYVEDPVRRSRTLRRRGLGWTFGPAVAATALLGVTVSVAVGNVREEERELAKASDRVVDAPPRCFGAASRDPQDPCRNPRLARKVVPDPLAARDEPNEPCRTVTRDGELSVCEFGVPRDRAKATVALLGDSHAAHWRPALEQIAQQEGWHGLSITRTSCPYSMATKRIPGRNAQRRCRQWTQELPRWLAGREDLDAVFVSASSTGEVLGPIGKVEGYRRAWDALPEQVRSIFVLRDTPRVRAKTGECVADAADAKRSTRGCAAPRDEALAPDPQVAAAKAARGRVHLLDVTPALCDGRRCWPVVGGALVFKDGHHMTRAFSASLAPQVRRQVLATAPPSI